MKKYFISLGCSFLFFITIHAQKSDWFVTLTPGYGIVGPAGSIKTYFNHNGFNLPESNWLFSASTNYPTVFHEPSVLITVGKHISPYNSIYLILGQTNKATVNGYDGHLQITINYNLLQFSAGYQVGFRDTHFKLGVGPTLFIFFTKQHSSYDSKNTLLKPGILVIARMPLGAEKKIFGVELFVEFNAASGETLNDMKRPAGDLPPCNISLVNAVLGISFAFGH